MIKQRHHHIFDLSAAASTQPAGHKSLYIIYRRLFGGRHILQLDIANSETAALVQRTQVTTLHDN
jgi:hypothetical protein